MKFKFADSISVGMDLQTIPLKAIINQARSSKTIQLESTFKLIENDTSLDQNIVKGTTDVRKGNVFISWKLEGKSVSSRERSVVNGQFWLRLDLQRCYNLLLCSQNTEQSTS